MGLADQKQDEAEQRVWQRRRAPGHGNLPVDWHTPVLRCEIKAISVLFHVAFLRVSARSDRKHTETSAPSDNQQIVWLPEVRNVIVRVHASTSSSALLDDLSRAKVSQEGCV